MIISGYRKRLVACIVVLIILISLPFLIVNGASDFSGAIATATRYSETAGIEAMEIEGRINEEYGNTIFIKAGDSMWQDYLDNRQGKHAYYVTYEVGMVISEAKDGFSYYFDVPSNYISYRGVSGVEKGGVVLTYFVWCNDCNNCDDIIARYDVVLKKGYEQ